jgi:alcohol dehydrogenase (NADP+)
VLTQTLSEQEDGKRLEADHHHATSDGSTVETVKNEVDLIVNTVSADLEVEKYLGLLAVDGRVGMPENPGSAHASTLAAGRRSLAGSLIGGTAAPVPSRWAKPL